MLNVLIVYTVNTGQPLKFLLPEDVAEFKPLQDCLQGVEPSFHAL